MGKSASFWGIVGVVAAFASTFFGVFTASYLTTQQEKAIARNSYRTLISVMYEDCTSTLNITKSSVNLQSEGMANAPGLMLGSLEGNSLLLDHMKPETLAKLVPALGRSAHLSSQIMRLVPKLDSLPPDFAVSPDIRTELHRERQLLEEEAKEKIRAYEETLGVLCTLLKDEYAAVDT